MNNNNNNNEKNNTPSDFQEMFRSFDSESAGLKYHQKPRKKRTKLIRIDNWSSNGTSGGGGVTKPKPKPEPGAPNITPPCSECGKKFWSWKALFGHMRCHPERQWRGINPPPNIRRPAATLSLESNADDLEARMSEEDHLVATCLIMLANGPSPNSETPTSVTTTTIGNQGLSDSGDHMDGAGPSGVNCRFECSSCKKVFGSHQALGGHRATHKNVKGCFAITRNEEESEEDRIDDRNCEGWEVKGSGEENRKMVMVLGHKCSICLRVFSSGQALGGHKRCHWEKGDDEPSSLTQGLNPFRTKEVCGLDLNLPAPLDDDHSSSSYSSGLALDLRLRL